MSEIQSAIFDKDKWSIFDSHQWLIKHFIYPIKSPHVTNNYIRYRINDPEKYNRLRFQQIAPGINFVIGFF